LAKLHTKELFNFPAKSKANLAVHLKMFLGKVFHFPEKLSRQRPTEKKGDEKVTNQCKPMQTNKRKKEESSAQS